MKAAVGVLESGTADVHPKETSVSGRFAVSWTTLWTTEPHN
jgi:hypothetical protein